MTKKNVAKKNSLRQREREREFEYFTRAYHLTNKKIELILIAKSTNLHT